MEKIPERNRSWLIMLKQRNEELKEENERLRKELKKETDINNLLLEKIRIETMKNETIKTEVIKNGE